MSYFTFYEGCKRVLGFFFSFAGGQWEGSRIPGGCNKPTQSSSVCQRQHTVMSWVGVWPGRGCLERWAPLLMAWINTGRELIQLGDFKIGGWGWKWSEEEKRNPSAEQELSARLLGEPEASWLSSAIPQRSGRLTPSLPKRATMPYNILTAWVFYNATIQNGCDTYFQTQQPSLQRDSWASFSFRTQLSFGLFTLNMLAPTSWNHWFIAILQI